MKPGEKTLYCPYCGSPRVDSWVFCQICRKALPAVLEGDHAASPLSDDVIATSLWSQAQTHYQHGEYATAECCLRDLSAQGRVFPEALALWGMICLRRYRLDEGRELLERAVATAPQSPFVRLRMAEYWLALGLPNLAQDELAIASWHSTANPALSDAIAALSRKIKADYKLSFSHSSGQPAGRSA